MRFPRISHLNRPYDQAISYNYFDLMYRRKGRKAQLELKPSLERNLKAIDFNEDDIEEYPTSVAKYKAKMIQKFFHMAFYNVEN